jgi:hypothetical protein
MFIPVACTEGTVTVGFDPTSVIVGAATEGVRVAVVPPEAYLTYVKVVVAVVAGTTPPVPTGA